MRPLTAGVFETGGFVDVRNGVHELGTSAPSSEALSLEPNPHVGERIMYRFWDIADNEL